MQECELVPALEYSERNPDFKQRTACHVRVSYNVSYPVGGDMNVYILFSSN